MAMRSGAPTKAAALGAAGIMLFGAAACTSGTDGTDDASDVQVVTGVYALEWLATRIGGTDASVVNLTEPGVDPHALELSPRQVGAINDADLLFYISGIQPAIDGAAAQQAIGNALDVADHVPLRPVPAEVGGGSDPHLWLDPGHMATAATALADRLAQVDPDRGAVYRDNAEAVLTELDQLDDDYGAGLQRCEQRDLVVSHAAFGYLADSYGLNQIGIAGIEPDNEPSPARLAEVARIVEERGIGTVFTATLVNPAIAETVAAETGAEVAVLDPLEGITDRSPGSDYPSVMRANLDTLTSALNCS